MTRRCMRFYLLVLVLASFITVISVPGICAETAGGYAMIERLHWLGQAGFRIDPAEAGGATIYTDPVALKNTTVKADLILISHTHGDHFSENDIVKLSKGSTIIVGPSDLKVKGNFKAVKPGDKLEVAGVTIEAVPAYNTNKNFHPRRNNWVGYIITTGNTRIYFAGDTDRIPEMKDIKADIAMMPVGGTYTTTASEAAAAALDISPKIAVPMHYGSVVGSRKDAEQFKEALAGKIEVVIKEKE